MKKILIFLVSALLLLFLPQKVIATGNSVNCDNRYVTLVNPVRGRSLWSDKTLKPVQDQYTTAAKYNLPITWLMQYDAISDKQLSDYIKNLGISGEKGIFLEISKDLAGDAGVDFNTSVRWSHPGVVFLSGYTQTERRILIDTVYKKFKSQFGYYPKSVGAWWIDSYSLNYIKGKYGLDAVLIVADQKTTDSYGVWGQWWGYPYIPSRSNLLIPANDQGLGAVVIQWAQRDPVLAYGDDPNHSNYSLQANDYIRNGENTNYFKKLVSSYLDCSNNIGQITVGMETGMEASDFQNEYANQLAYLSTQTNLKFVTMSEFSRKYEQTYRKNPNYVSIGDWKMDKSGRANPSLGDFIYYPKSIAFADYYVPDRSDFLKRIIDNSLPDSGDSINVALIFVVVATFLICVKGKFLNIWASHMLFVIAAYGLLYKSGQSFGWYVYYGLVLKNLFAVQVITYLLSFFVFFYLIRRLKLQQDNLLLSLIPLSFGLDGFLSLIRTTTLSGQKLVGLVVGVNHLVGLTISTRSLGLFYDTFPFKTLKYFYKFPFEKVFNNEYLYLLVYPTVHILAAMTLYLILRRGSKSFKYLSLLFLAVFYVVFLIIIHTIDPVAATAITNQ